MSRVRWRSGTLVAGVVVLSFMTMGFVLEQRITTIAFARLEADQIAQDAQRVRLGLDSWVAVLRSYGSSNSIWDSSFTDVARGDRDAFAMDLPPLVVATTSDIDGVIGVGPDGALRVGGLFAGGRYAHPPAGLSSPEDLSRLFDPAAKAGAGRCGVVMTSTEPFVFCGFASHRSDGGDETSGGLIYLKSLGDSGVATLGDEIRMPLRLTADPGDATRRVTRIDGGIGALQVSTREVSGSQLALTIAVETVGGGLVHLQAERPRLIYRQAVSVAQWLMLLMGLLGCLLIASVIVIMRREVHRRVGPLRRTATQVIESGDRTLRIASTDSGDLRVLADTIDSMLDSMANQDQTLYLSQAREREGAITDPLTGLSNRNWLTEEFEGALRAARDDGTRVGFLLIDLDRFKEINDTLGHEYGDHLLVQIGPRIAAALRETDSVSRMGGDEFSVLLPGVDGVDAAVALARSVRATLQEPFLLDGIEVDVEASVGVVVSGEHGDDVTTLIRRADVAMYTAKKQNLGVFAYDRSVDRHSTERLTLLSQLRRGLDRGELVLHYQPKISLLTGEVVGAEALVRWLHPERGLIPPDRFIPLAEGTGLIGPLTLHVLDLALSQAAAFAAAGHAVPIAVNLSPRNLLDPDLCEVVSALLAKHEVPAHQLELEVTETAIMTEPVLAGRILAGLSERGIRLAIDDFGAGYTSLAQLRNLPVTELKVDQSFVMTMDTNPSNAVIVESVIGLGHNLGLTVVAEGVETARAMDTLAEYGCDIAQGYHLSRPLPPDAFLAWCVDRLATDLPWVTAGARSSLVE